MTSSSHSPRGLLGLLHPHLRHSRDERSSEECGEAMVVVVRPTMTAACHRKAEERGATAAAAALNDGVDLAGRGQEVNENTKVVITQQQLNDQDPVRPVGGGLVVYVGNLAVNHRSVAVFHWPAPSQKSSSAAMIASRMQQDPPAAGSGGGSSRRGRGGLLPAAPPPPRTAARWPSPPPPPPPPAIQQTPLVPGGLDGLDNARIAP